jgi:hypothetical protein
VGDGDQIIASGDQIPFTSSGPFASGISIDANDVDFIVATTGFYLVNVTLNVSDGNSAIVAVVSQAGFNAAGFVQLSDSTVASHTIQVVVTITVPGSVITVVNVGGVPIELDSGDVGVSMSIIKLGELP